MWGAPDGRTVSLDGRRFRLQPAVGPRRQARADRGQRTVPAQPSESPARAVSKKTMTSALAVQFAINHILGYVAHLNADQITKYMSVSGGERLVEEDWHDHPTGGDTGIAASHLSSESAGRGPMLAERTLER